MTASDAGAPAPATPERATPEPATPEPATPASALPTLAVIGAGAHGRAQARLVAGSAVFRLAAVADPAEASRTEAAGLGVPVFASHRAMLDIVRPRAAFIATPNQTHLAVARDCIAAGVPVLVEKPIADSLDDAEEITRLAAAAGVPLMVGHHRRHNPIIRAAREAVRGGRIGTLVSATVLYAWLKHDAYFAPAWRREPGGGPVLINLIHEIDLIRFVCGEIAEVHAVASSRTRGFAVEDTAAVVLVLEGGALVTINLSDTTATPWSWDLATRESPGVFPALPHPVQTHFLCGTRGGLSLPDLALWTTGSWHEQMRREVLPVVPANPYVEQLRHLLRVIRGQEPPVSGGADATRTLRATRAVLHAAATGTAVRP